MQCERLINLAKNWYLHVKDETMAPARMIQFMKEHVNSCKNCQDDPSIQDEIEKITEMILPESKIPKAIRLQQESDDYEDDDFEDVDSDDDDEVEDDDDTDDKIEEEEEEEEEYMDDDDDDLIDEDLKDLD